MITRPARHLALSLCLTRVQVFFSLGWQVCRPSERQVAPPQAVHNRYAGYLSPPPSSTLSSTCTKLLVSFQVCSVLPVPAAMLTRGQCISSSSRDVRCCPTRPVADPGAGASASPREQCSGLVRASSSGSWCSCSCS